MMPPSRRRFLTSSALAASVPFLNAFSALASQLARDPTLRSDAETVEDVVAANRILANELILDGYGHVSARLPRAADRFWLARSVAPELVTSADIMEYDLDANPIDARGR